MNSAIKRIGINPAICHGKPIVRGMRWPVEVVLDLLSGGMTPKEIINDHPELELEDIAACLNYAKISVSGETVQLAN